MRTASPARRAAGLLAVTTIGLSTAVLSVTGVASAELPVVSFTTDPADPDPDSENNYTHYEKFSLTVPEGYCSIDWGVYGASGGASSDGTFGADGGGFYTVTNVVAGDVFAFTTGGVGGNAVAGTPAVYDEDDPTLELEAAEPGTPGDAGLPGGAPGTGDDDEGLGGGGGGLTTVTKNSAPFMSAFGGDGGSDLGEPAHGGAGAGDEVDHFPAGDPEADDTITGYGNGVVSGFMIPCEVTEAPVEEEDATPGAPDVRWVQGVAHGLAFQLWASYLPEGVDITGVEYSLNGGAWTAVDSDGGNFQREGVIPGLVTGRMYTAKFRFLTTAGPTEASETLSAAPVLPAPGTVKAVAGVSSIAVSWTPPADEPGVTGYRAWVLPGEDPQSDSGRINCTQMMGPDARGCLIGVPAGKTYSVFVAADSAPGLGEAARVVVDVPKTTVPATLPTADAGDVTTTSGTDLAAGEKFTLTGSGYLRGSTVELIVYSTPTLLGTAVADGNGNFSAEVTLPKELANGKHHLVAAGVDANGNPRYLVTEVTVTGGVAAAGNTGGLAYTGSTPLPFVGAGVLALAVGGGLLVASRRRQA